MPVHQVIPPEPWPNPDSPPGVSWGPDCRSANSVAFWQNPDGSVRQQTGDCNCSMPDQLINGAVCPGVGDGFVQTGRDFCSLYFNNQDLCGRPLPVDQAPFVKNVGGVLQYDPPGAWACTCEDPLNFSIACPPGSIWDNPQERCVQLTVFPPPPAPPNGTLPPGSSCSLTCVSPLVLDASNCVCIDPPMPSRGIFV